MRMQIKIESDFVKASRPLTLEKFDSYSKRDADHSVDVVSDRICKQRDMRKSHGSALMGLSLEK